MDETLYQLVRTRIAAEADAGASWARLLLASCRGDDALAAALAGNHSGAELAPGAKARSAVGPVYLDSVSVEGFRGVGASRTLQLGGKPGLTLVVGRNGSGKSSFAEAIEILLTGHNARWSKRSKVWKEGWRNLHHAGRTEVRGEFTVEGDRGKTIISRCWEDSAELDDGVVTIQRPGTKKADAESLYWDRALALYRPFLPYNELGTTFDEGPTALHDHLSAMLGLEDLVIAQKSLGRARLAATQLATAVRAHVPGLLQSLSQLDDERAQACVKELSKKKWNLARIEKIMEAEPASQDGMASGLRQIAGLEFPTVEESASMSRRLRSASARVTKLEGVVAAQARDLAALLQLAVDYHAKHRPKTCPVCETGTLGSQWQRESRRRLETLTDAAEASAQAAHEDKMARDELRLMLRPIPVVISRVPVAVADASGLIAAWKTWLSIDPTADLRALADHVESVTPSVRTELVNIQRAAAAALATRDDAWRKVAMQITSWLSEASVAQVAEACVTDLRKAETWLKETATELRKQRFEPVASSAIELWGLLRQQSSVGLEEVGLEGSGPTRRPLLRVEIDGVKTEALSVMSQGELHSLALSLFLPRATLPESPFRFVVIDDPVQSMDPARVEGLVRALEVVARARQVVVFTHDDRLPEAVRRLKIAATIVGVTRQEGSIVEVRIEEDPVTRALSDARALSLTSDLPESVAQRIVPGLCRVAMEAALHEVIRRRRLGRGERHADVDALLVGSTFTTLAALALFDDGNRGAEVMGRLNRDIGSWAGDTFAASNRGAHQGYAGNLGELVMSVAALSGRLRSMK